MWTYAQKTGAVSHNGLHIGDGYSGHGAGLNYPILQSVKDVGPCPDGLYTIGLWHDEQHLGPTVARLTPVGHDALGRTDLFIHGDNRAANHTASEGCIILGPAIRNAMRASGDSSLTVISGITEAIS